MAASNNLNEWELLEAIRRAAEEGVAELDLSGLGIKVLPPEIGALEKLRDLNLSGNGIAKLPPEIGRLASLQRLDLTANNLAVLPSEFGQLGELTDLNLSYNDMIELPDSFRQLGALEHLSLWSNHFQHFPVEITQLEQLVGLTLADNGIKALPTEVGQFSGLRVLSLARNDLVLLPAELGQLEYLTELDVSGNPLEEPPPDIVEQGTDAILRYLRGEYVEVPASKNPTEPPPPRAIEDDTDYHRDAAAVAPKLGFPGIATCIVDLIEAVSAQENDHETRPDILVANDRAIDSTSWTGSRGEPEPAALALDPARVTIGLYGPWGAGKSTLINALRQEFARRTKERTNVGAAEDESRPGYFIVPINPWKWDGASSIGFFLRDAVLDALTEAKGKGQRLRFRAFLFVRRYGTFGTIVLAALGLIIFVDQLFDWKILTSEQNTATSWGGSMLVSAALVSLFNWLCGGVTDRLRNQILGVIMDHDRAGPDLDATMQYLARLFSDVRRRAYQQFVFVFDDLDRCEPDRIADFLNSVHSLTSVGGIVFIACDED